MIIQVRTLDGNVLWMDCSKEWKVKDLREQISKKWPSDSNFELFSKQIKLGNEALIKNLTDRGENVFILVNNECFSRVETKKPDQIDNTSKADEGNSIINRFIVLCSTSEYIDKVIDYTEKFDEDFLIPIIKEIFKKLRRHFISADEAPAEFISQIEINLDEHNPENSDTECFVFEDSL